jgi:hypothetical protein
MKASDDQNDRLYKQMSMALQSGFKQVLHDTLFSDVHNYANVSGDTPTRAVLAFCSIPACSDVQIVDGGDNIRFLDENALGKTIYWNWRDRGVNIYGIDLREKVLFDARTQANLQQKLVIARARIQAAGDPDHVLSFYGDNQMGQILGAALHGQLLDFLFPVEANMVEQARGAGLLMAAFQADGFSNPERARQDLAQFGQKLSVDFNTNLKNFAVGNALLPLGTAVYSIAARVLDPTIALAPAAMFIVQMLKPGVSTLEPEDKDILRTERVLEAA